MHWTEKDFEASMRNVSSEDEAQYRSEKFGMSEEYWLIREELPRIQRQGDLLGTFSFLENRLNNLCSRHEKALQFDDEYEGLHTEHKKLKDINEKGLDRAVAYLKRNVVGIKFPSESHAWRETTSIQKIRNVFTHREGFINKDYDAGNKIHLENYINKSDYLQLKNDQIIILNGFVNHCLDQFESFFHELMKIMEDNEEK